jgi:hypothetical protein
MSVVTGDLPAGILNAADETVKTGFSICSTVLAPG